MEFMRWYAQTWRPSLPSRGAWIEIDDRKTPLMVRSSLPSRGAWIEITLRLLLVAVAECRSPRGERGLKYEFRKSDAQYDWSLPSRGAWIEIPAALQAAIALR